ncbi:MAG TPA: DUF4304 domain-containing protein [Terracidiphilus sp.]|nr:DUF4304 domain-containing protein [Terracidiphilus sp.]
MRASAAGDRNAMEAQLKSAVVPILRGQGFRGSFPHFRPESEDRIDLLTLQFDRNGGGFVIEAACAPPEGITTYWGKVIEPQKITAWDIHPDKRRRIKAKEGSGTDSWFRYDQGDFDTCVKKVLGALPSAEIWLTLKHALTVSETVNFGTHS